MPTGDEQLDDLGAAPDLVADRLAELVGSVCRPRPGEALGLPVPRGHVVAVSRRDDLAASRDHARPLDEPVLDGLPQRRIDVPCLVGADHRRVPGPQRQPDVVRGDIGLVGGRRLKPQRSGKVRRDVVISRVEMPLRHAGHDGQPGAIDHAVVRAVRRGAVAVGPAGRDLRDAAVLHDDRRTGLRGVLAVQHVRVREHDLSHSSLLHLQRPNRRPVAVAPSSTLMNNLRRRRTNPPTPRRVRHSGDWRRSASQKHAMAVTWDRPRGNAVALFTRAKDSRRFWVDRSTREGSTRTACRRGRGGPSQPRGHAPDAADRP